MFCEQCAEEIGAASDVCPHCGHKRNSVSVSQAEMVRLFEPDGVILHGSRLMDRYEILSTLSCSSTGCVFVANDHLRGTEIALKTIPPELRNDDRCLSILKSEFASARGLIHEHICQVYDFHECPHTAFVTMDFIKGHSLDQLLAQQEDEKGALGFPIKQVLNWLEPVSEALDVAHQKGVVHCALKPSNIMIELEGTVKITDFCLARATRTSMNRRSYGIAGATLLYMSPEQIIGRDIQPRSDVYSLGMLAYELLTGKTPFAEAGDVTHCQLKETIRAISGQPTHVNAALAKACAKKIEDRHPSAGAFLEALKNVDSDATHFPAIPESPTHEIRQTDAIDLIQTAESSEEFLGDEEVGTSDSREVQRSVECPHCNEDVEVRKAGSVECPHCGDSFAVNHALKLLGERQCCPYCSALVYVETSGTIKCPECESGFSINDGLKPIGKRVFCPYCNEGTYVETGGAFKCERCDGTFSVSNDLERAGKRVACPHCDRETYFETAGDVACSHCEKHFELDADFNPAGRKFVCPHCEEPTYSESTSSVRCLNCRGSFNVNDASEPVGVKVTCPFCYDEVYVESGGSVECRNCGESFPVNAACELVGKTVACPYCDDKLYVASSGNVECQNCSEEFEVNDDLEPVGTQISCPHCDEETYITAPGTVECPSCYETFEVSKAFTVQGHSIAGQNSHEEVCEPDTGVVELSRETTKKQTFIAFDFETTGFQPATAEIIEIGAVRFDTTGTVLDTFEQLIRPVGAIEPRAQEKHGISAEMLADCPSLSEVLPRFLEYLGTPEEHTLIAHNAALFDLKFVARACEMCGLPVPDHRVLDSIDMCIGRVEKPHNLPSLCERFAIQTEVSHRALADAMAVMALTLRLATDHPDLLEKCPPYWTREFV